MNLFEKVYNKFFDKAYSSQRVSYSQCGEDLIVDFLLTWVLGIKNPTYLDIGAHHPFKLNNTYLFYKRGLTGVNIEPDILLFNDLIKYRSKDINVNSGVGYKTTNEVADFYVMSARTLNTFSKEEAERMSESGNYKIDEIKQVELININEVFSKYFNGNMPDFFSLDVEGYDVKILESIDFLKYSPKIVCVETISFTEDRIIKKQQAIADLMTNNGYLVYADTAINSIFVKKELLN
jgi:FkbM family methyltransferase